MEELISKIKYLEQKVSRENVLVPKVVFWSLIVTIAMGIFGNFIFTWNRVNHIEKEISLLKVSHEKDYQMFKVKLEKDLEIFSRIEKKVEASIEKLSDIEKQMLLKKDKKWVE